jgi:hypothetical protein
VVRTAGVGVGLGKQQCPAAGRGLRREGINAGAVTRVEARSTRTATIGSATPRLRPHPPIADGRPVGLLEPPSLGLLAPVVVTAWWRVSALADTSFEMRKQLWLSPPA